MKACLCEVPYTPKEAGWPSVTGTQLWSIDSASTVLACLSSAEGLWTPQMTHSCFNIEAEPFAGRSHEISYEVH